MNTKIGNQTATIIFLILLLCAIGFKTLVEKSFEKSIRTKQLGHYFELESNFKGTDIMIPQYFHLSANPYKATAIEQFSLEKSMRMTKWDGYNIIITPTKLSESNCFQIVISGSQGNQKVDRDTKWTISDMTQFFQALDNHPRGEYRNIQATFQQAATTYEVIGYIYGPSDEARIKRVKSELMFIIDSMKRVE